MCRTPRPEKLGKSMVHHVSLPPSSHRAWLLCFAPDTFVPIRSSQLSPQPESTALRGYETTCMPEWRTFPLARPPNDDANDGATVRACTNRLTQGSPPDLPGSPIVDLVDPLIGRGQSLHGFDDGRQQAGLTGDRKGSSLTPGVAENYGVRDKTCLRRML